MEKQFTHKTVTVDGGSQVAQFENDTQASADVENRNKRAEEMGIKTRYAVAPIEK